MHDVQACEFCWKAFFSEWGHFGTAFHAASNFPEIGKKRNFGIPARFSCSWRDDPVWKKARNFDPYSLSHATLSFPSVDRHPSNISGVTLFFQPIWLTKGRYHFLLNEFAQHADLFKSRGILEVKWQGSISNAGDVNISPRIYLTIARPLQRHRGKRALDCRTSPHRRRVQTSHLWRTSKAKCCTWKTVFPGNGLRSVVEDVPPFSSSAWCMATTRQKSKDRASSASRFGPRMRTVKTASMTTGCTSP